MSENARLLALEKENRILRKQLERSKTHRIKLENAYENQQTVLFKVIQGLEQSLEELTSTQLQLIEQEKMSALGNLVAGVAHEINNPISYISGNITELEYSLSEIFDHLNLYQHQFPAGVPEKIAAHAEEINLAFLLEDLPKLMASVTTGCDRIHAISRSLRNFSRIDHSHKILSNLHEAIDGSLLILKHRLKANNYRPAITVTTNYSDIPPIPCFPNQLNQVFMNILANAIDALDGHSQGKSYRELETHPNQISITTEVSQHCELPVRTCAVVHITDNGPGIPDHMHQKIFEHLYTTKQMGKGTGLGLTISQKIVTEHHGGRITVDTLPGQSTRFSIYIPYPSDALADR